jgi:hypothetical protein
MSDEDKPRRAPRQPKAADPANAKPARGRKAKNEINLDDALKQTRDAAFLAGGAGGKDLTKEDRAEQMRIARGVAAGMIAAQNSLTQPEGSKWTGKEKEKKEARSKRDEGQGRLL